MTISSSVASSIAFFLPLLLLLAYCNLWGERAEKTHPHASLLHRPYIQPDWHHSQIPLTRHKLGFKCKNSSRSAMEIPFWSLLKGKNFLYVHTHLFGDNRGTKYKKWFGIMDNYKMESSFTCSSWANSSCSFYYYLWVTWTTKINLKNNWLLLFCKRLTAYSGSKNEPKGKPAMSHLKQQDW